MILPFAHQSALNHLAPLSLRSQQLRKQFDIDIYQMLLLNVNAGYHEAKKIILAF